MRSNAIDQMLLEIGDAIRKLRLHRNLSQGVIAERSGIVNLAQALELRKQGGGWLGPVIMAALTVAAGLFLVFFSFGAMKAAVMVIGGVIVYNGVSNLLIESKYRKTGR